MVQRLLVPKRRLWIKAAVAAQIGKLLRFAPKTPKFGPNKLSAGHECACLKRRASISPLGGPQGTHGWVGSFRALFWIFATLAYNICKLVGVTKLVGDLRLDNLRLLNMMTNTNRW
jgi:hypothetical protein